MEQDGDSEVTPQQAVENSLADEMEEAETGSFEGGMVDEEDEEMLEDEVEEEDTEEDGDEEDEDEGDGEDVESEEQDEEGDEDDEDDDDDDDGDEEEGDEEDEDEDEEDEEDGEWETLDETEKCPVCLDSFFNKDVGTPESCDHFFCLDCILEWSRTINTCPVDRSLFRSILVRHSLQGEVVRSIEVDERKPDQQDEEDATYCEVCGRCDREDRLLLCDGCDAGYHCECLDPPLEHIPVEEWYCPECVAQNRHQEDPSSEEELEIVEPLSPQQTDRPETHRRPVSHRRQRDAREHPRARAIARTHVSERVRARITQARAAERRQGQAGGTVSTSSTFRSAADRKKPVKRKTTKKRKTVRKKRRTSKKRKTSSKTGTTSSGKQVVKKRKFKRRKKRRVKKRGTKAAVPKTIRGRIAGKLMLVKPRTGSMMPDMKVKGQQSLGFRRHEIGAATLLITGHDNLLDMSEVASTSKTSAPAKSASTPHFVSSSSTPDLLGSIISGQDMLLMGSQDVTIHRDGSLTKSTKDKASHARRQLPPQSKESSGKSQRSQSGTATFGDGDRPEATRVPTQSNDGIDLRDNENGNLNDPSFGAADVKTSEDLENHPQESDKHLQDAEMTSLADQEESPFHVETNKAGSGDSGRDDGEDEGDAEEEGDVVGDEEEDRDLGEIEEEEEEEEMEEEMEYENQPSDTEKTSGKHDGSITCQVSSSSFEESDEEGIIDEKRSSSRKLRGTAEQKVQEGPIRKSPSNSKCPGRGNSLKVHEADPRDRSGKSRRKSSVEEGLIEEDEDRRQSGRTKSVNSFSEEEGLIPDEQDYKRNAEDHHMLHSDEEGLIADDEDGNKVKEKPGLSMETGKQEFAREYTGHSSAEEGEVKTDDEEGSNSTRKKRKRERRRQRNRKDTRTVVIDSELSLTVPKRPLAEILGAQKMTADSRSSDSAASRDREYERSDAQHPEPGVFSDLRHVIQVKREVPHKRPSRYEAYWAELERQRAIETQMAEKAVAWEHHGIYERPYPYEEDWNRMILDHKPLEPQWENFTIHRERSPAIDWRKDRDGPEERVEAERRIEMVQQGDHDRRFEAKRRAEAEQKQEPDHRFSECKVDARKDHDRDKKSDQRVEFSRVSSRKTEMDKGRNDHKREAEPLRESRQKGESQSKTSHKTDVNRRKSLNPESDGSRRRREDSKKENSSKAESEKDPHLYKKDREKREKHKVHKSADGNKQRDTNKSESQSRHPEHSKPSSHRDKDRHRDGHESKQRSDREVPKETRGSESSKTRGREHSKEQSASQEKDRSLVHDRSSSRGIDRRDRQQELERHREHSSSRSKERSTSRGHSQHKSKRSREYSSQTHEHIENLHPPEDNVMKNAEKYRKGTTKSRDKVSAPKDKEKKRNKDGYKKRDLERSDRNVQQATSTSDAQAPVQTKSSKRIIRQARSPSTSQTGETGDEFEASQQPAAKQLPITVPATEMVIDKPVVEKVKKKKKDKGKKVKNKGNDKVGTKGKKTKKNKTGKNKKQKVAVASEETQQNDIAAPEEIEQVDQHSEEPAEEVPCQQEEIVPETTESIQPETSPVPAEPEKAATEDTPEKTMEELGSVETEDNHENEKELDSSSDVELVSGPVKSIYDEIIDLSQISSDEESDQLMSVSNKQAKDNTLYDPFEPTASPETISSPDVSERNVPQRRSQRSRDRSRSPQRKSNRNPLMRRSSPKRRSSPRRQRSPSPRRKSPAKKRGTSKEHGYSTRKRSISPPRKSSMQKRRSPSPRRTVSDRNFAHSPRKSPSRLLRRAASPKRHISPRKRSISPRGQSSSKRRRAESPRRRSMSPRRNVSLRRQKPSPKKSISPRRRHVSPRRRSRSPRKRTVSPRQRVQRKRSLSPRRRSVSPRRRNISPKRRKTSPKRRDTPPKRRHISPKKQIDSSRKQSISPRRRSLSPHRQDFSPPRRPVSGRRRSMSSRSSSTSSRSSRSLSSSSSWSSSSGSWSSSSYSRSPSDSRGPSISRSPSPRRRRYSRDRSSSSFRSDSSFSSERSSSPQQHTPQRPRSVTPKRTHAVLRQSPTQTSSIYRHRTDSEKTSPVQPHQDLPDSTQGSYRVVPSSPQSPDQTMAPATSTTDSHLSSKATSQISHILGQLACNPAIQSALNSANLIQGQRHTDTNSSSDGSISGFLKSSDVSFTSPPGRVGEALQDTDDKDLSSLADVNEDNIESSAVDLYNKNSRDRYLKKLQHQERVVEEVKLALKPYYQKREVNKDDYKEILRKSVNQVCHSKSGEINPVKIKKLIEGYIKKFRGKKKVDEKETSRPDLAFRLLTKS